MANSVRHGNEQTIVIESTVYQNEIHLAWHAMFYEFMQIWGHKHVLSVHNWRQKLRIQKSYVVIGVNHVQLATMLATE